MLIFLLFTSFTVAENETLHFDEHNPRIFDPPPREHLADSRFCRQEWWMKNDSTFSCFGAKFVKSDGFFQPCNQHSHCYESREPTDWCILSYGYRWSNWGCHCDKKFNSCVIERWNGYGRQMEWGYCTPKKEFHCDPEQMKRKERVDAYLMRMKG
ncbi:unnamed protein product, partial [Mesorhabditis belari]|uniref:Uncharacterized protein n=1 Tax=Mesorhabditis belari TaxID=2138241 RepID=A0AAF3J2P7_9BILA